MKRREDVPISKHTLNLFEGDYEALKYAYPRIGAAKIVRTLVRRHLRELEALAQPGVVRDIPLDLKQIIMDEADTPVVTEL